MKLPKAIKKIFRLCGCSYHSLYYFEKNLRKLKEDEFFYSEIKLLVRQADSKDIEKLLALVDEKTVKLIRRYLNYGSSCFMAFDNNEIAGYSWINMSNVLMDGYYICPVSTGGVFTFGGFVFPHYRGKKVFQQIISHYCREFKDKNYFFIGNFVARNNSPALGARKKFSSLKKKVIIVYIFHIPFILGVGVGKGKLIKNSN
jgi:hypothetical protein